MKTTKDLHQTVHWRKLKAMIKQLLWFSNNSGVLKYYDLNKIACYRTIGKEMNGMNVETTNEGHSCFIDTNAYDIFEVPCKNNKSQSLDGKFLVFAYNVDFNYWMVLSMISESDESLIKMNILGMFNVEETTPYKYEISLLKNR